MGCSLFTCKQVLARGVHYLGNQVEDRDRSFRLQSLDSLCQPGFVPLDDPVVPGSLPLVDLVLLAAILRRLPALMASLFHPSNLARVPVAARSLTWRVAGGVSSSLRAEGLGGERTPIPRAGILRKLPGTGTASRPAGRPVTVLHVDG